MEQLSGGQVIFLFLVLVWLVLILTGLLIGMRKREHAHRERLAVIEKGLAPSPEMYPNKYDAPPWAQAPQGAVRFDLHASRPRLVARKLGLLIICTATGIAWLLAVLGEAKIAVAVGGLIGMMGVGFIIMSFNLAVSSDYTYRPGPPGPPPPGPS